MAITTADKLYIYNGALYALGERKLSSVTEDREPRHVLDQHWGSSDEIVTFALARAEWNFAIRTVQADYDPAIEPDFGFRRVYQKPSDFVRLAAMSPDEYLRTHLPHESFVDESGFWFADHDILYIRYVSNDTEYGFNSALWTEGFKRYLQLLLAWYSAERLTNSTSKKDRMERDTWNALRDAKSSDAMNEGVKYLPSGSWSRSRSWGSGRERGRYGLS